MPWSLRSPTERHGSKSSNRSLSYFHSVFQKYLSKCPGLPLMQKAADTSHRRFNTNLSLQLVLAHWTDELMLLGDVQDDRRAVSPSKVEVDRELQSRSEARVSISVALQIVLLPTSGIIGKNQNAFAKRQREMDKKRKAEEKRQRRVERKNADPELQSDDGVASDEIDVADEDRVADENDLDAKASQPEQPPVEDA
ncbi:hypothetical protein NHH03_09770 [Stieleria sp. TO1_6]|uniref:hypothetical protein n=1 Tax=Stieleria tagensis TaxID=2956795 RepID=UPI00209A729B|nr:hypothetical protein [Stieleria tagensis]MCO8122024.1 hypothetical protein [Stieleria tagensis]